MSGYQELRDLGVIFRPFDGPMAPAGGVNSPFEASWSATVETLARELRMLDAKRVVVELDLREGDLRVDGIPKANARLGSGAVRISFESKHGPLRYETNEFSPRSWSSNGAPGWQANLRAIALGLEALRKVDRYGVSKRGEQYRGWRAIEQSTGNVERLIATPEQARGFLDQWGGDWKRAARETHPDAGGDETEFRKVMRAKELIA